MKFYPERSITLKTLFNISVSAASGIEAVTKRELYNLGVTDAPAKNGRISFTGDGELIAKCNLLLRTANRVYVNLAQFKACDFDELYDGVYAVDWCDYLTADAKIIVSAKCVSSRLMAASACQSICKKAICEKVYAKIGRYPSEDGARYKIEISVLKDVVTVSLDTSGEGLHKRGYRGLVGEAPLKETLASALIQLSVWNPSRPFADVFCGSGTFPIEAALIAKNIPSGLNRDFDFLKWRSLDLSSVFNRVKEQAISEINPENDFRISGFDIDENQIRLANRHAVLAGVDKYVHLQRVDMRDFSTKHKYGVFISNPPYGERLSDRREVTRLYKDFSIMVSKHPDWSCYTLTSVADFEKWFGKRADKKRKIFNGKLECYYYSYLGEKPVNKLK